MSTLVEASRTADNQPSHATGLAPDYRLSIIAGTALSNHLRADILARRRPRIDILEMELAYSAHIYDFSNLTSPGRRPFASRIYRQIVKYTNYWSLCLAHYALPYLSESDIVYATGEDVGLPLAALMRAHAITGPRIIMRLEQPTYGRSTLRRAGYNLYFEYGAQRIERIICRTDAHLQYLNSALRIPLDKLCVLREETDPDFYHGDPVELPATCPVDGTRPYIVSAGLEMRDYPTLIAAARDLDVQLVIAAGSPWSHSRFDQNTGSALPCNVHVAAFSPLEMRALYANASFVVVPVRPTLRACGMNVVLEAWAMKKAVIATRTLGLREYVADGETGLLVNPNDAADLRSKLQYLLAAPSEARSLGLRGHNLVQTELNIDQYVRSVRGLLASSVR